MRFIILTILFLIPLLGFASFPIEEDLQLTDTIIINGKIYVGTDTDSTNMYTIEKETTEITKELSNQSLDSKKPWYNTWWAILLQFILFPIGYLRLLISEINYYFKNKKYKPWRERSLGNKIIMLVLIFPAFLLGLYIIGFWILWGNETRM